MSVFLITMDEINFCTRPAQLLEIFNQSISSSSFDAGFEFVFPIDYDSMINNLKEGLNLKEVYMSPSHSELEDVCTNFVVHSELSKPLGVATPILSKYGTVVEHVRFRTIQMLYDDISNKNKLILSFKFVNDRIMKLHNKQVFEYLSHPKKIFVDRDLVEKYIIQKD